MKNITRLLIADTHFTDKPADEYRWGIFPWLKEQVARYGVDEINLLGDLTDSKEGHKADFVNRLSAELAALAAVVPVKILEGNHDRKLKHQPFFKFLDHIPGLMWIDDISDFDDALFLPHSFNPEEDWQDILHTFDRFNYVFMHQCFMGAKSSLGFELEGAKSEFGRLRYAKIYAGDIHLPQQVGQVEYVGSPYPVHFGDRFLGRCIITDSNHRRKVLHYPTIEKFTAVVESPSELLEHGLEPGDQIKVRFKLQAADRDRWPEIKETIKSICNDMGVYLGGIELLSDKAAQASVREARTRLNKMAPEHALKSFARREGLPEAYTEAGMQLLGKV